MNGVFFVGQNIGTLKQVKELIKLFKGNDKTPVLAIDHEGSIIQRLNQRHGFIGIPTALESSRSNTSLKLQKRSMH